ncbi:hypothetical protein BHM03_00062570, partial [Ensete ventricosum]
MRKCRFQPRALLQQALRVAVPCASADVSQERRFQVQICRIQALISSRRPMRKCRFQPLAVAGIASVPVPSPSADLQNSGASALLQQALGIANNDAVILVNRGESRRSSQLPTSTAYRAVKSSSFTPNTGGVGKR